MTTNSEWLESLAKSDPKALQAWFDAEHVEGGGATSNLQWMVNNCRDVVVEALSELGLWCTKPPYPCLHRDDERGCETCRGEDVPARIAEWLTAEHVDGTNGDGDGTNGIAGDVPLVEPCTSEGEKVQGLPDDNVLYLLRDVAKKSDGHTLYHGITKLMQAIGKEPEDKRETGSELAVALNTLADMVERDYVKRESIEAVMDTDRELVAENIRLTAERDELKAMNDRLQVALDAVEGCDERCKKLEADRDGWKAKAEHYGDHVDRLMEAIRDLARKQPLTFDPEAPYKNAELVGKYIDELKAKAEIAERAMNAAAGKLARADARSAERAAAVERLRNCLYTSDSDLMRAMLNWGHEPHTGDDSRFALIDLLTDEPMDAQPDGNGTCPDGNGTASNRNPFYAVADALGVNCADRTDERIAERMLEVLTDDWMELPRDKYDEVIHLEDVMTAPGEDCWTVLAVNEGGFLTFHEDGSYHMRSCRDWQHTLGPVDAQSKTEPKLTEQSESLSDEPDSREKLEADARALQARIWKAGANNDGISLSHIIELLDRQASITERDVRTYLNREDSELVQAKVDNLQGQIEHLREEIAKRDKGIERLKRQRDEARDGLKNACWEYCETCEHDEQVSRLQRENIQLARDLAECEREREVYRRACGELLDYADQMRLVRLDGCGEELADGEGEVVS